MEGSEVHQSQILNNSLPTLAVISLYIWLLYVNPNQEKSYVPTWDNRLEQKCIIQQTFPLTSNVYLASFPNYCAGSISFPPVPLTTERSELWRPVPTIKIVIVIRQESSQNCCFLLNCNCSAIDHAFTLRNKNCIFSKNRRLKCVIKRAISVEWYKHWADSFFNWNASVAWFFKMVDMHNIWWLSFCCPRAWNSLAVPSHHFFEETLFCFALHFISIFVFIFRLSYSTLVVSSAFMSL